MMAIGLGSVLNPRQKCRGFFLFRIVYLYNVFPYSQMILKEIEPFELLVNLNRRSQLEKVKQVYAALLAVIFHNNSLHL